MSQSQELLLAINQEAISRMSPYELVDRAVALRTGLGYNTLDIEPIDVEGGTLYTVTSGIVAERPLHVETTVEEDEIVRRQTTNHAMTLFADVVELRPPAGKNEGEAHLYHVEDILTPALNEHRAPFRPTILKALQPGEDGRLPAIHYNSYGSEFTKYNTVSDDVDSGTTLLSSRSSYSLTPLLATPDTWVHITRVGVDELAQQIGVRTSFSGPAQAMLNPHHLARVTSTGVIAGPPEAQPVTFTVPDGTPQYAHNSKHHKFERIPDDAVIGPNDQGELVMSSTRASEEAYKYTDLKPYIDGSILAKLVPPEAITWPDVTDVFLKDLAERIAKLLPLDGSGSWEQTRARAQDHVRDALANHKPVLGGIGCLAVAARMAELPPRLEGNYLADRSYFQEAS